MVTLLTRDRHQAGLRAAAAAVERCAAPDAPQREALADVLRAYAVAPVAERDHWARRACHEATLLALVVDPEAAWLGPDVAADGVDELLTRCRLRPAEPGVLVVAPDDRPEWWALELGPHRPRLGRHTGGARRDGDWELTGPVASVLERLAARAPMSSPAARGLSPRFHPTTS